MSRFDVMFEHNGWCSPMDAALQVQSLLKLSAAQLSVLCRELDVTSEDPVLVVQVNPAWVTIHGQEAADAILDFIGEFEMEAGQRRDSEVARRYVYHFGWTCEIGRCEEATEKAFPLAFALSPKAIALGAIGVPSIPLAFCVVVHKIGVRHLDVAKARFFYL